MRTECSFTLVQVQRIWTYLTYLQYLSWPREFGNKQVVSINNCTFLQSICQYQNRQITITGNGTPISSNGTITRNGKSHFQYCIYCSFSLFPCSCACSVTIVCAVNHPTLPQEPQIRGAPSPKKKKREATKNQRSALALLLRTRSPVPYRKWDQPHRVQFWYRARQMPVPELAEPSTRTGTKRIESSSGTGPDECP